MEKLYYSISEVAEQLGINLSKLRFWEKEFKELSPEKNEKGTRFYTEEDIRIVKQIMYLVNEEKLTLDGARRKLSEKKDFVSRQQEVVERLKAIREELMGIAKQL